jgi:hypothetical protein
MKMRNLLIAITLTAGLIQLQSCNKDSGPIKGEGPIVQQNFFLPDIYAIALSIDANVCLIHGDTQVVRIEGQQNIINNIEKYVDADGFWMIQFDRNVRKHDGLTIYITTTMMDYIHVSGSGSVTSTNIFPDTVNADLMISGSGNISMMLNAGLLKSTISGSGEIDLTGSADEHRIAISGSGDIRSFGMPTLNTFISISGSGSCEVNVQNLLDVNISGSGDVYYIGYPEITSDISGSGGIYNRN